MSKSKVFTLAVLLALTISSLVMANNGRIALIMIETADDFRVLENNGELELTAEDLEDYAVHVMLAEDVGEPMFLYYLEREDGWNSDIQELAERGISYFGLSGAHEYTATVDDRNGGNSWNFSIIDENNNEDGPRIRIEPDRLLFEDVELGRSLTNIFTVSNIGNGDLILQRVRFQT
ncbi:MAG: hypothetical protein HQ517_12455, partial [SAR324 cluster bacterium]|nr:hypothetical protein [SAR324 cluster bacterium]